MQNIYPNFNPFISPILSRMLPLFLIKLSIKNQVCLSVIMLKFLNGHVSGWFLVAFTIDCRVEQKNSVSSLTMYKNDKQKLAKMSFYVIAIYELCGWLSASFLYKTIVFKGLSNFNVSWSFINVILKYDCIIFNTIISQYLLFDFLV